MQVDAALSAHIGCVLSEELHSAASGHIGSFSHQAEAIEGQHSFCHDEVDGAVVTCGDVLDVGEKLVDIADDVPVAGLLQRSAKRERPRNRGMPSNTSAKVHPQEW